MDIYTGPEQRTSETYMIPGSGPNPHLTYVPQLEEVDYMGSEVAPEYIYDQGLYYPVPNYFGYYCPAGFESPGDWEDQSRFFGVDGQDLNYSGMQTEGLPYVYYAPTYGYAQSPYNPYNPYIPGAVMGLDGPYIGTHQQYITNPPYPSPESSPAYIPVLVQPSADIVPSSNHDPSLFGTGSSMLSRHSNAAKYTPNAQRSGFGNPTPETSRSSQSTTRLSEGSLINAPPTVQSHGAQIRNSSGSVQAPHHFSNGRVPTIQNPSKITPSSNDSFPQFGPNIRGWATVDKFRPRLQYQEGADVLGEQNKGPRTNRSKGQWAPVDGAHQTKSGANNAQQSIVISSDQYNRDDLPVNYQNAKFFVIKSYSEDDVHKSIKYNVWSSTANGNKRLDSAYQDAQRVSLGQSRNCPIFLFFSVNASGQFCGVAEMIGPVDFDKDMDFWQQDKWTGSFPVKWHIVKDVGNTSFRHIILENNENKPVTNSRDTQEIPYLPGINMLNIFKGATLKTSIIDDFMFYEERERIMQEEKARILGRSYDSARFLPAVVPVKKNDSATTPNPPKADEKECNGTSSEPSKSNAKQLSGTSNGSVDQSPSPTGKPPNDAVDHQPSRTGGKPSTVSVDQPPSKSREEPTSIEVRPPTANRNLNKLKDCTSDQSADQPPSKPREESTSTDIRSPTANRNPSKLKDPKRTSDQPADQLPSKSREESTSTEVRPPTANRNPSKPKDPNRTSDQPADQLPSKPREESTTTEVRPPTANRNLSKPKDPNRTSDQPADQPPSKPREESTSTDVRPRTANRNPSKLKDKSLKQDPAVDTIDSKVGEASGSGVVAAESSPIDVVTVGSMSIRVKGLGESSSSSNSVITVGTIPIEPKSSKHNKQGATAGGRPNQK